MIFESDATKKEISEELRKILTEDNVKFYFLFDRNSIASANLPAQMKEFMFNPQEENVSLRLEYDDLIGNNSPTNMDLDTILEKLSEFGIESLTRNEKKFLDNFKILNLGSAAAIFCNFSQVESIEPFSTMIASKSYCDSVTKSALSLAASSSTHSSSL